MLSGAAMVLPLPAALSCCAPVTQRNYRGTTRNRPALTIPDWVIVIYCVGVLYNPAGFIAKAINPKMGNSDSLLGRLLVCLGFVPATLGFGYLSLAILSATLVA